jgi:putative aminopeptidase FrvX
VPLPELLERLLTTPGPSGQEQAVAAVWREAAAPVGEVSSDVLGSSWVRVPGTAGGPSLAVVGHIDEIGVVVTHLGDDGIAAVRPVGGFSAPAEAASRRGAQADRVPGSLPRRRREGR